MEELKTYKTEPVLYLLPTTLGDSAPMEVLPLTIRKTIETLTHFIVENEKEARRFIKRIIPQKNQEELILYPLNKFTDPMELQSYLDPMNNGYSMGLMSDAGCPGVADPGAVMVKRAHQMGYLVKPLVGPSSILLALMASGMNGQSFAFNGYLPIEKKERIRAIKQFEKRSGEFDQTQLFIETPYRNEQFLQDLLRTFSSHNTVVCSMRFNIAHRVDLYSTC